MHLLVIIVDLLRKGSRGASGQLVATSCDISTRFSLWSVALGGVIPTGGGGGRTPRGYPTFGRSGRPKYGVLRTVC